MGLPLSRVQLVPFTIISPGCSRWWPRTRSYKEAQTYLSVVMLVPLIPVIVGTVMKAEISSTGALIPGFSQHLLIMEIIKGGSVSRLFVLYSAATTLAAGLVMIAVAAWLYRSERILG